MPNTKKKGYTARDLRDVSDSPELTKEDFAKMRAFAEALPELAAPVRKAAARIVAIMDVSTSARRMVPTVDDEREVRMSAW